MKKLISLTSTIFRSVQSILKSPDLDSKYEKFAATSGSCSGASPKTSRRKFLNSRLPAKSGSGRTTGAKSRKASASKTRQGEGQDSPRDG